MKKLLLTLTVALFAFSINSFGQACPGNLVLTNPAFGSGLTGWTQYGAFAPVAMPVSGGCINNCMAMQATNNSHCGASQPVNFRQDSCYTLCYCYEFPQSGSLFNAKLVVAATNGTVTPAQLLTGSFTASQAQILDVVTSTTVIAPTVSCTPTFTASGNFSTLVIINQTIGAIGTDVRVDNICLQRDTCASNCNTASLVPGFTYVQGPGLNVNFTSTSTVAAGYSMTYVWDFDDPPSGVLNTSTLATPSHLYPFPGAFIVCLHVTAIDPNGVTACVDSICIDMTVFPTGLNNIPVATSIKLMPNPASDMVTISSGIPVTGIQLYNSIGQMMYAEKLQGNSFVIPSHLPVGVYTVLLNTPNGQAYKKLVINR